MISSCNFILLFFTALFMIYVSVYTYKYIYQTLQEFAMLRSHQLIPIQQFPANSARRCNFNQSPQFSRNFIESLKVHELVHNFGERELNILYYCLKTDTVNAFILVSVHGTLTLFNFVQ